MKKIIILLVIVIAASAAYSFLTSAENADMTPRGWYVVRNKTHEIPSLDGEMAYITDHKAYYADLDAKPEDKVIYLTFDAGYENGNVEKILDALKKHDAKGAFFILENLVKTNTDLVIRMKNEGHLVCNHTAKHPDMTKKTDFASFERELKALEEVYAEYTGNEIDKYFRPPEGKFNEQTLMFAENAGYKTVFWSCAYADWDNSAQKSGAYAINLLKANTHNGMILLLHPTSATNAEILDTMLTYWESEGFRFGTLDELK